MKPHKTLGWWSLFIESLINTFPWITQQVRVITAIIELHKATKNGNYS